MKITVVGRQMNVPEYLKELSEKKLAKLDRYFPKQENATVTFSKKRNSENVEITIAAANTIFRCETEDETFRNALDRAVETIDRQIRKNRTKLEKRFRKTAFISDIPAEEELSESQDTVVRRKEFQIKPMSVDEAILQMNLLGHQFYLFTDSETSESCVVYVRRSGGYGLIVGEK